MTALLERGWLRSGSFIYKPCNHKTCCPNLAIRLDVHQFEPSSSQLRVLRRWEQVRRGRSERLKDASSSSSTTTSTAKAAKTAAKPLLDSAKAALEAALQAAISAGSVPAREAGSALGGWTVKVSAAVATPVSPALTSVNCAVANQTGCKTSTARLQASCIK